MSNDYLFLKACRGESVERTPIWIMRQAGRYMKEYRAIRAKMSFLELCKAPEAAVEVTLQPIDILGVDAAILFSDILVPLEPMGINLTFSEGRGPVIEPAVRTVKDVEALRVIEAEEDVPFVMETIRLLRKELEGRVPVIGFSGAPFTLASYMIEGGTSKAFIELKSLMYKEHEAYDKLMTKLAKTVINYLNAQIAAGAQAVQVFDTWAGILSPYDYKAFVAPYTKMVIDGLNRENVPVILYANGSATLLKLLKEAGPDVMGVDWRINLDDAIDLLGGDIPVQGNLDPTALFLPKEEIPGRAKEILDMGKKAPGHIFNLGHGVLPPTDVDNVKALVDAVHELSQR
jgi:uroporphyrinogen decarboxylase